MVGDFACLRVVSVNPRIGAFLDWGLTKDLLLPHRAQADPVQAGEWIVVHVHLDDLTGRIIASSRLHEHLALTPPAYAVDQSVALLIVEDTPLGYRAIIEGAHWGLLYRTELSGTLTYGEKTRGFIKEIRPDGKIALRLDPAGYQRVAPLAERILIALRENGGRLEFDDASTSDAIRAAFGVSKKSFKQALGSLYRDRRIRFAKGGTELARR